MPRMDPPLPAMPGSKAGVPLAALPPTPTAGRSQDYQALRSLPVLLLVSDFQGGGLMEEREIEAGGCDRQNRKVGGFEVRHQERLSGSSPREPGEGRGAPLSS